MKFENYFLHIVMCEYFVGSFDKIMHNHKNDYGAALYRLNEEGKISNDELNYWMSKLYDYRSNGLIMIECSTFISSVQTGIKTSQSSDVEQTLESFDEFSSDVEQTLDLTVSKVITNGRHKRNPQEFINKHRQIQTNSSH